MKLVERFLGELADAWGGGPPPTLRIIGSTALMLQTSHTRQTKDSDVLETVDLGVETKDRLLDLGGPGSPLARRWKMYVDVVPSGLPFLPLGPHWRDVVVPEAPPTIHFQALDVVDVTVSKLKRFSENDKHDVSAMVALDLVPHAQLIARFVSAVDAFSCDARAEDRPRYVRNLHEIERDLYGRDETEIELPSWI